jgi:S-adenosylmethionine:tRNA ribosyltransferase-isomerase
MKKSDFNYRLPPELIAQVPPRHRGAGRMLVLDGHSDLLTDGLFMDLPAMLTPGDLLVFNDTRVIPARLSGHKDSGGKIEILIERIRDEKQALAQVKASKPPRVGAVLHLDQGQRLRVIERREDLYLLELQEDGHLIDVVERVGHVPLPPYIRHPDTDEDRDRYQTVFARRSGAIAAPTAGLHFDHPMLDKLAGQGIELAHVTLHVGSGTFQPVRVENLDHHSMHAEHCEIDIQTVEKIRKTRAMGRRVVAVGTTVVRTLETAARSGQLEPFHGDTRLFIQPGFKFHCVDALLTNFHLPESTLLSLVCAFAGYERVMRAYAHAVQQQYRFFSYGDCMFLDGFGRDEG